MINIAVMSDIHFGSQSGHKEFAHKGKKNQFDCDHQVSMLDGIKNLFNQHNISYLLLPGDLCSESFPSEYSELTKILRDIVNCNGNKIEVIFTQGNHDSHWGISDLSKSENSIDYDEIALQRIASSIIEKEFGFTNNFTIKGPLANSGLIDYPAMQVLVLNSGFYSKREETYHRGKLGEEQLDWISKVKLADDKWKFVLLHHHLFKYKFPINTIDISCVDEGDSLLDLLVDKKIDLIVHGHRHHPIIFTEQRSNWLHPISFLCAGSLSANTKSRNGIAPNTFHIISLDNNRNSNKIIVVHNYQYSPYDGWEYSSYSKQTPFDSIAYIGNVNREEELLCYFEEQICSAVTAKVSDKYFELINYEKLPNSIKCTPTVCLTPIIEQAIIKMGFKKSKNTYPDLITFSRRS